MDFGSFMVIRQPFADGRRRPEEGVPSLNVIGQIDLFSNLDSLLINAGMFVAGPAIVLHRTKDQEKQ